MENLKRYVELALVELEQWRTADGDGATPENLDGYRSMLSRAARAKTIESLEREVSTLLHSIVDSGPLSSDFLPSLELLSRALQEHQRRLSSCRRCSDLKVTFDIRTPDQLQRAIRVVRDNLADGTLEVAPTGHEPPQTFDIPHDPPWPDAVDISFRCKRCHCRFRLVAETYHGAGGSWTYHLQ